MNRKAITAAVSLLVLLGQIDRSLHLVAVQHVTCEHGELVDVDRTRADSAAGERHSPAFQSTSVSREHEHGHCVLADCRSHKSSPFILSLVDRVETLTRTHALSKTILHVDTLLFAPKTSPPASLS